MTRGYKSGRQVREEPGGYPCLTEAGAEKLIDALVAEGFFARAEIAPQMGLPYHQRPNYAIILDYPGTEPTVIVESGPWDAQTWERVRRLTALLGAHFPNVLTIPTKVDYALPPPPALALPPEAQAADLQEALALQNVRTERLAVLREAASRWTVTLAELEQAEFETAWARLCLAERMARQKGDRAAAAGAVARRAEMALDRQRKRLDYLSMLRERGLATEEHVASARTKVEQAEHETAQAEQALRAAAQGSPLPANLP